MSVIISRGAALRGCGVSLAHSGARVVDAVVLRDERRAVLRAVGPTLGRLESSSLAKLSVSSLETQLNSSRKFCASQLLDSTRVGKTCYSGELESPEIA